MPPSPKVRPRLRQWLAAWSHTRGGWSRGCRAAGNLLFPPCCAFCRREMEPRTPDLCPECVQLLVHAGPSCVRCASPLPALWNEPGHCPRCRTRSYPFDRAVALGQYRGEMQQAVLWMKRSSYEPLTRAIGQLLGDRVQQELVDPVPELVAPIPMHFWRRIQRGTQTSLTLGTLVAASLGVPLLNRVLRCKRNSLKQGTLETSARFQNVRGAFSISPGYDITDKHILLVDDILTTGATASEAARLLRRAGAASVGVAVAARAMGRQ